jgi:4-hydroxy-tetrahydrodipicolinate synthase
MARMINAVRPKRPEFVFLTGWDVVLIPMMLVGADGGTNATSGIVPELMRKLFDLGQAHKWEEAMPLQLRLIELFDTMLMSADFPEGFRAAVELRGFDFGKSRQPLSEPQSIDRMALQRVLRCILADFGVVDAPAEGCIPRSGNLQRDKVMQVTEAVMARLRERGMG